MLHVSPSIPPRATLQFTTRWTRERLKAMRARGDPLADACVAELHRTSGLTNIHDLLGIVRERAAQGDAVFAAFVHDVDRLPAWFDEQLVNEGSNVLAAYLLPMYPSLLAGSLVGGAMFKQAALVTYLAGSMSSSPSRRIGETASMIARLAFGVQAVMPGGEGHEMLARVRLLHAGLRHWLPASGRYKDRSEIPINQHDLGITLALFGYVNLRSLRLLGVSLSRREIAAYMALWRYAGFLLGIEPDMLFEHYEEQEEFFLASCIDEADPSSFLATRATSVLDAKAKDMNDGSFGLIPTSVARTLLHQLTRYLMGNDYVAGIPDLGDNHWTIWLAWLFGRATSVAGHYLPAGDWMMRTTNRLLLRNLLLLRYAPTKGMSFGTTDGKIAAKL